MPAAKNPGGFIKTKQLKKRQAQMRVLELLRAGLNITQAMKEVDRHPHTFQIWKTNDPWFAARARQMKEGPKADDFTSFRKNCFGFDTYWHQERIIQAIEETKGQQISLVLLPPRWGKTTVLEDYMCYVLSQDPNHNFCVISETQHHSRKILGRIQRRMTDEEGPYYSLHGPFKSGDRDQQKPWNADYFTILQAADDQRDYSIEARGAGSKLYGSRYDTIIVDDIQSQQSLNGTQALFDFIRGDLFTRPGVNGRIIFIGTRVGPGDIYEAMLEAEFIDHLVLIPARDEEGRSLFPPVMDGKKRVMHGMDPLGFSEEELETIEGKVGTEMWAQVYMQQPQSKTGAPFTEDRINRACDENFVIGGIPPGLGVMGALDPALSGYASIKVCAYDSEKLWLVDSENIQAPGRYEELYAKVETYQRRWQCSEWVFEVNAMQGGLARDDRLRKMADDLGFRIVEHTTRSNKMDSAIGVASMADAFGRSEVVLPFGDEPSRRQLAQLVKELRAWRPDIPTRYLRQDEVMCLWFCYLHWTKIKKTLSQANKEIVVGGLPWKPTGMPRVPVAV